MQQPGWRPSSAGAWRTPRSPWRRSGSGPEPGPLERPAVDRKSPTPRPGLPLAAEPRVRPLGRSLPRQAGEAQPDGRAGADRHHHDAAAVLARAAALRLDAEGGDARRHLGTPGRSRAAVSASVASSRAGFQTPRWPCANVPAMGGHPAVLAQLSSAERGGLAASRKVVAFLGRIGRELYQSRTAVIPVGVVAAFLVEGGLRALLPSTSRGQAAPLRGLACPGCETTIQWSTTHV